MTSRARKKAPPAKGRGPRPLDTGRTRDSYVQTVVDLATHRVEIGRVFFDDARARADFDERHYCRRGRCPYCRAVWKDRNGSWVRQVITHETQLDYWVLPTLVVTDARRKGAAPAARRTTAGRAAGRKGGLDERATG